MNTELLLEGIPIAVVGYSIVFAILVILYLVFFYLAKLLEFQARERCKRAGKSKCAEGQDFTISGEVSAAISMALYLHFNEMHDIESGKLTVKTISKRYTPWNSKIYNVMNRL